jgi:hypothetical protein
MLYRVAFVFVALVAVVVVNSQTCADKQPVNLNDNLLRLFLLQECCQWSKQGKCASNKDMRVLCQKSCGTCGCTRRLI